MYSTPVRVFRYYTFRTAISATERPSKNSNDNDQTAQNRQSDYSTLRFPRKYICYCQYCFFFCRVHSFNSLSGLKVNPGRIFWKRKEININHALVKGCLTLSQTTKFKLFQIERVCRRQFQI